MELTRIEKEYILELIELEQSQLMSKLDVKHPNDKMVIDLIKKLNLHDVSQQRELLEALKGIIQCCDGNEPKHEQIYHIANDAVKACNCG